MVALDPVHEEGDDVQENDADHDIEAAGTAGGTDEETTKATLEESADDDATEEEHATANVPLLRFSLPRDAGAVRLSAIGVVILPS
ncbi:hypothetical protein OG379_00940 [Streptomyces sp. NBC_01166]|uniref:hypothetical protein n=1 Tax=Streptomyces sp. NBC_01166 TaxID=2903755 RepID=UPI003869A53B|nr:hypothetical protein OG379_00940 [Streptomyces sp. NBC_01166]